MKEFDAVIIGAGLAGLQCAGLLGGRGAKILLVDRKTDLAKGVHTTGIFVRKTLEDFDFPAGTLGKAVRNVTLYSPRLKAVELKSEQDEFRVGKMGALYESMLRKCLENGVEFCGGTRYLTSEPSAAADGFCVRDEGRGMRDELNKQIFFHPSSFIPHPSNHPPATADGSDLIIKLEKNGLPFEVGAKVLIGADGANSRVAKDLGLDENKEWIVGYEEVFHGSNPTGAS